MTINASKIKKDIYFYFWFGITLYSGSCILNIMHLYQWKGRAWVDFIFHLVLFSVNVGLISKVKEFSRLARTLILLKILIFSAFFYPKLALSTADWIYSKHWPHGILQRCFNMGIVMFDIYFAFFLMKRSVRFVFNHKDELEF